MPISPTDRDLAELAAASRLDETLCELAGLACAGGKYMLGLLINGMTIYGRTESPGAVFAEIDAENARLIERGRATGDSRWSGETVAKVEGTWTRCFEEYEREHRKLMERNEGKQSDEMPEDDIREEIKKSNTTLVLADVEVVPPSGPHLELPLMRVQIAQVAGWWLIPTDAQGNASYSHPSGSPSGS